MGLATGAGERMTVVWGRTLINFLRTRVDGEDSASEAAIALNQEFGLSLSRNAVIGKARRCSMQWKNDPPGCGIVYSGAGVRKPNRKRRVGYAPIPRTIVAQP